MESLTLTIGIVASLLVFTAKPIWSLVIYCAVMAWYPSYLTVKLGTIDFTACRIIILALYANLFLRTKLPKGFKVIWLDKLIIIYFLSQFLAGLFTTQSLMMFLENRAGAVFDRLLPYFAVRMILTTKGQYLTFLKAILCLLVPLACLGLYQSITGHNVVEPLKAYATFPISTQSRTVRYGFYRADVTFPQPIMFGLFLAMLGAACVGLFCNIDRHKLLCTVGIVFMAIGVLSSMSSGPLLAVLMGGSFIASYRWRRYWKPVLAIIIIMCGTVEIISNRHFYDVLGDFALKGSQVWYRSRLIDVALFEGGMSGHWLIGHGIGNEPGWGAKINALRTDTVHHYLLVLSRFGLVGLVPFLAMIGAAVKRLVDSFKICTTESVRWLVWCLSGSLFGIIVAMNSVCLFGHARNIFYIVLALCGVMPNIVKRDLQSSFWQSRKT